MATIAANPNKIVAGGIVQLTADPADGSNYQWTVDSTSISPTAGRQYEAKWDTSGVSPGGYTIRVTLDSTSGPDEGKVDVVVLPRQVEAKVRMDSSSAEHSTVFPKKVEATVRMERASTGEDESQALWVAIRNRTAAIGFDRYSKLIDCIACPEKVRDFFQDKLKDWSVQQLREFYEGMKIDSEDPSEDKCPKSYPENPNFTFQGPYAYSLLKLATQVFLILECGVVIRNDELFNPKEEKVRLGRPVDLEGIKVELQAYLINLGDRTVLPYLNRIIEAFAMVTEVLPYCKGILKHRSTCPSMLELIWSYWHEEGMLVQTMNAITMRFQNRRASVRDPLAQLEIDPLRPLNNLLWGFIQDEQNRLSVPRRAYEYDHHYGLTLLGKAVPTLRSADSRSKFIESFHNLLHRAAIFYREDSDTTVVADAFPLLNALREVHLILAEGAHNQFGDLPWTARVEMLIMQWLLARPEMREFLRGRHMVPYHETWMGAVDAMKKLQGWTDTGITHFHELAVTGERILLSLRYGDWMDVNLSEAAARAWARYWKPEIQRYIHDYHAVTGVDLAAEAVDSREVAARYLMPSVHLQRRLSEQTASRKPLPPVRSAGRQSKAELEYHYRRAGTLSGHLLGSGELD